MNPPQPRSTLFPYTTLFRSRPARARGAARARRAWPPPTRGAAGGARATDRKSTRLNSSHVEISYAVFCLKKKSMVPAGLFGHEPGEGGLSKHVVTIHNGELH